ncbi:MAG TPA: CapA family protein [Sphingobacterium sp.]|jgi:hypothetical protein|nr:CapA family protein [Sphingobacterium sp.]
MHHKLLFVGDIVLETEPVLSTELQEIFAENVIRSCNVEAPLRGKGQVIEKTGPSLNQRPDAARLLRTMGFNLFAMANNHIFDYGEEAMLHTISSLDKEETIGAGDKEQAYRLLVRTIDDIRYGFLAYGENGYGALDGKSTLGYAWVNHPRVNSDIAVYRATVDMLIVQVHAGVEMVDVPIPEWRDRYRELIDCGADIVIGHHPHIVQGMEYYKSKPIFYSLGNFYFDGIADTSIWNTGAILQLEVKDGQLSGFDFHVVEKSGKKLVLKPQNESKEVLEKRSEMMSNELEYLEYINTVAVKEWQKHHSNYYAKAFNGLSRYTFRSLLKHIKRLIFNRKIDYNIMWHNLAIESNLWIVRRAIERLHRKK